MTGTPTMVGDDDDDFNDFLARVEDVSQAVGKLVRGELDPDACEALAARLEPGQSTPRDVEAPRYRPGSGSGDQYAVYCRRCAIEHDDADIEACAVCGRADALDTRAQRHAYLKARVQQLLEERDRRAERRRRWRQYRDQQPGRRRQGATDFDGWCAWEPDTDSDSDPIPDRNDPRFAALDADLRRRDADRERKRRQADALKADGNACVAQRRYHQAIDLYTQAIELRRDCLVYYTNRALAHLRLGQYGDALADSDAALDLAEFLDGDRRRPGPSTPARKAWLRRAQALDGLGRRDEAIAAVRDGALVCAPADAEAGALLAQLEADAVEAARERQLRAADDGRFADLRDRIERFRRGDADVVVDDLGPDERILFRVWKGLEAALDRLPHQAPEIVPVLIRASTDNDRNLHLIAAPKQLDWIAAQLQAPAPPPTAVALALCRLLRHLSRLESVRRYVTAGFEADRLWHGLERFVRRRDDDDDLRCEALGTVASLATVARFRRAIHESGDGASRFHRYLIAIVSQKSAPNALKESALLALGNVLLDDAVRGEFGAGTDARVFEVLVKTVSILDRRRSSQRDALLYALTAIVNLMQTPVAVPKLIVYQLVPRVAAVLDGDDPELKQRCLLILGRCPAHDLEPALASVYEAIGDRRCREAAARVMAVLSQRDTFLDELYRGRTPSDVRRRLAQAVGDSDDARAIGNLCLCISRCLQAEAAAIDDFIGIVSHLIELVLNSDLEAALRKNVAIVLAKMSANPAVLDQMRQRRVLECILSTAHQLLK